jgi:hypothetical protein
MFRNALGAIIREKLDYFEDATSVTERIPWWWHLGRTETCSGLTNTWVVYILVLIKLGYKLFSCTYNFVQANVDSRVLRYDAM